MELYLSSYEYPDFSYPRKIVNYKKIKIEKRKVLVIEVDMPLQGQKYGLKNNDIVKFYLINRIDENSFEKFNTFPIDVFVLINTRKNSSRFKNLTLSMLTNIAWACLYDNKEDAINHRIV